MGASIAKLVSATANLTAGVFVNAGVAAAATGSTALAAGLLGLTATCLIGHAASEARQQDKSQREIEDWLRELLRRYGNMQRAIEAIAESKVTHERVSKQNAEALRAVFSAEAGQIRETLARHESLSITIGNWIAEQGDHLDERLDELTSHLSRIEGKVEDGFAELNRKLDQLLAQQKQAEDPTQRPKYTEQEQAWINEAREHGDAETRARAAILERDFPEADRQLARLEPALEKVFNVLTLRGDRFYYQGQFDEAVAPYRQALNLAPDNPQAQCNLARALQNARRGSIADQVQEAIDLYTTALTVCKRETHADKWAEIQNNLGAAWASLPTDDRSANLKKAIQYYNAALEIHTREAHPNKWAMTQDNLGKAWRNLPTVNREVNLKKAIQHYNAALEIRTRETHPDEWAGTQNNLGNAWTDLPTSDREANLKQANQCFKAALEVYTREAYPNKWAGMQNNLGNAWNNLPTGNRKANLKKAIQCYNAALEIHTRETHPTDWATTQNNLGTAWANLPPGDREANLKKAVQCYNAALEIRTQETYPDKWAETQINLGNAWASLLTGDRKANLEQAIQCYDAALKVFTAVAMPHHHTVTLANKRQAEDELDAMS